jgi:hypothetical protein
LSVHVLLLCQLIFYPFLFSFLHIFILKLGLLL